MWGPACCRLTKPSKGSPSPSWAQPTSWSPSFQKGLSPGQGCGLRKVLSLGKSSRWVFVRSFSGPSLDSKHHLYSDLNGLLAPNVSGTLGGNRAASAADSLKNLVFPSFQAVCIDRFLAPVGTCHRKVALQTHAVQRMPPQ